MSNPNALAALQTENARLIKLLEMHGIEWRLPTLAAEKLQASELCRLSTAEKVTLFRRLFRGRTDVYPIRWESKTSGKSGYAPACANEWRSGVCEKPRIKCGECDNRLLIPLSDAIIYDHLAGEHTVGVYPLLDDDTCYFLAVDFDEADWRDDALAFMQSCVELGVPAALEISRSGRGAHAWIFFASRVPAGDARRLGTAIISHTCARTRQLRLSSYDRLFPNQDTMPKGGFGNLIALPLQRLPRKSANSVFINADLEPYPDQWQFLASIVKLTADSAEEIVAKAQRRGDLIGVRMSLTDEEVQDPWTAPPSHKRQDKPIPGPLPRNVQVIRANLVYVEKKDLPPAMLDRLLRLAAFQNPEFYKAQAMRLSTYDKPRVIACGQDFPLHVAVPRGCLAEVLALLAAHKIRPDIRDERYYGLPLDVAFQGELRSIQEEAVNQILEHDDGILCAPTAFGKTAVGRGWLRSAA
jgi:hypothetical protein